LETLLLYKRFIDDVLIVTKDSDVTELKSELNSLHPAIKLTWTDAAKHCSFLDVNVFIKNNKLHTNVYQKQLNTYAYLPFHSYHTKAQKRGFIKGEAIRYARICTSEVDFKLMVKLFTLRLQRRGYPLSFIHKSLGQVSHKDRHNYTVTARSTNKNKAIPLLFKTEYNPIVSHLNIRTALNPLFHIPEPPCITLHTALAPKQEAINENGILVDVNVQSIAEATSAHGGRTANIEQFFNAPYNHQGVNGATKKHWMCKICP
jgi:hypothetical protein